MDIGLILAQASDPTILQTIGKWAWMIFSVAAGLTFVIFVHELGHFLVAKACGVKCEKFYVGFDFLEFKLGPLKIPRALVKFQWGETEYGLGSLPLGGYVKMLGQDDDPRNAEQEAERTKVVPEGTAAEGMVEGQTVEGKKVMLDPRSFPAKPVPARMAIISAGVIMNLIFAVIMAAVAYRMGVPQAPAVVGSTAPGAPAWSAGLEPGSKIVQLGKSGRPYDHLRYVDLMIAVALNGYDSDLPVLVERPDGQRVWYELRPSDRLKKAERRQERRPQVGVALANSREIAMRHAALDYLGPQASTRLHDKDTVIRAAGQPVDSGPDLEAVFAQNPYDPLTLTVERKPTPGAKAEGSGAAQTLDVVLQPRPMRELGAIMRIGPIVAVRANSPAKEEGFQVGDVIVEIGGKPVGDPLSLSQRHLPKDSSAEPIEFVVLRKDSQGNEVRHTLSVIPELPRQSPSFSLAGGASSIESIGVAFAVTSEVAEVVESSPAAKAGLQPGDKVKRVEFPPAADSKRQNEMAKRLGFKFSEPFDIDDDLKAWTYVNGRLQLLPPETEVTLVFLRDGKSMTATMTPRDSDAFFDESRGLALHPLRETHQAADWGTAFQLGLRETYESVSTVLGTISSLLTGKVSPTNIMGPVGIVQVAGTFASEGVPTLLIFLTLLSANLAVLNFLPIPALDGGHMLFLMAEWIRGKPVDERLQIRLTVAGILCLLSLMVFATAMDVGRFAEAIQRWFG